jgi:RNA polymerase sigma-70 factor, ECF subfamily
MTALAARADDDSLSRAQRGDHDAFAAIIRDYQSVVYGIAYHFFSDRAVAEELAQDVFLQLYRNLAAIQTRAHLLYWLRQVTSRKCIDEVRRSGPTRINLDEVDLAVAPQIVDPFVARRVRELIAALPDMQRLVLTLRYQEELGPSEIGQIIGMPENTVKSCLHRALTALRKEFQ